MMDNVKDRIIMIIDDDPDDRDILFEIVNQIDPKYQLLWGKDGVDGLFKLSEMRTLPDYIFLDLNMPRMNGKQCLAEIKQHEKYNSIPVIIYSTSKLESDIIETKTLGANYYMTKPNLFTDLREAITGLLVDKDIDTNFLQRLQ
jgi:DNA-binding response OmpR family regulator